jgi:replicative DNA helicase
MQPDDWRRLTEAAAYCSSLPIWIDDTPAISLLELRAKVRRIRSQCEREGRRFGLIVVDYLQLMRGTGKEDNREQVISGLSQGLKALAKEAEVPIIALSQLNRSVETRSTKDKRPQLSDLRECIAGDQEIVDAVTGEVRTIADIANGTREAHVYGLDTRTLKVSTAKVADAWSTGVRPVFTIRTQSGRTIKATANHPFYTYGGWRRLDELTTKDKIAVPRVLNEHSSVVEEHTADELRLIGYLISDGHYGEHRSVGYVKGDHELVRDVERIALELFGVSAKEHKCQGSARQIELTAERTGPGGNPVINWLKRLGIHGQLGENKRAPKTVFRCSNKSIGVFLGALWSGDGTVVKRKNSAGVVLKFVSSSMGLLADVEWMLQRLGVGYSRTPEYRNAKSKLNLSTISIAGRDAVCRFYETVELRGSKAKKLASMMPGVLSMGENAIIDRLPIEVCADVASAAKAAGLSWRELGYRVQKGKRIGRDGLLSVADRLCDERLTLLASSDVLWDGVESVTPSGECETFDMSVPGMHNFVVNGVFAHNSGAIEQDADVIIFVYRDEYYTKEKSARPGIAELIIAKQRNGPTGTVYTSFQGSCTRFDNLDHNRYLELLTEDSE